jgi:hypothetical protein
MLGYLLRLLVAVLAIRLVWRWLAGPRRRVSRSAPPPPAPPPAPPRRPVGPIVDAEFEDLGEKERTP